MTVIRVDPASVGAYGAHAQHVFGEIRSSLTNLVDGVVGVRYFGPNAVAFKTECGRMAAEFANRLHADMGAMADAVRQSTSNISAALGGEAIVIGIDPQPIVPPIPDRVAYVDVDTGALEALIPVVNGQFTALADGLNSNVQRLEATDWVGNAKNAAVDAVQRFTAGAQQACSAAQQALTDTIRNQVDSVITADR